MPTNPIDDALARYDVTRQQMLASSGVAGSMQAAYGNIHQGYVTPQQAAAAGALPGYPLGMMTPASAGVFRTPTVTPPPPVFAHPGVTAQFADAYEMQLVSQRQTLSPLMDPANAASEFGRRFVNRWGAKWGGPAGAVLGFTTGVGGGAVAGYSLGEMIGGSLGNIPIVGDVANWVVGKVNQQAAEQLSQGLTIQYGTMGMINMGQRDIGLGGRGMSTQAATALSGKFRDLASQAQGFNANDLINVTTTAAESGLLTGAVNIEQIFDKVTKLMGLVGQVARLTGDPDFRNNLRAMGEMVRSGVQLGDIPQVMASMNMYSRMAGMTRGEAGMYGRQGAAMFGQIGLTTGLGQQVGIHGAAMANLAQGAFSPEMLNLLGGREGLTQRYAESAGAFLTGAGSTLLPYLATMQGGRIGIDPNRLQQLQAGDINLSNIIGAGAANIADPRMQRQMLIHRRELASQLGQMAGPMGIQGLQFGVAMGLTRQGMDLETAAVHLAGGDELQGSMLYQTWTSRDFQDRYRAQIEEQRRRIRFQSQREAAARREAEPSWLSRRIGEVGEGIGETLIESDPLFRRLQGIGTRYRGWQARVAREEAQQIQEEQDVGFGFKQVYGPNWAVSKTEQAIGRELRFETPGERRPGRTEFEAVRRAERGDVFGMGFVTDIESAIQYGDSPVALGARAIFGSVSAEEIRTKSQRLSRSGQGLGRARQTSDEEWLRGLDTARKTLTQNQLDAIRRIALRTAKEKGRDGEAVVTDEVMQKVKEYFLGAAGGEETFRFNEGRIRSLVEGFIARSGDADVRRATQQTLDKAGVLKDSYNVTEATEAITELTSQYGEALQKYGMTETAGITTEERERVAKFLDADAATRAGAIIAEQFGEQSEEFRRWAGGDVKRGAAALALREQVGSLAQGLGGFLKKQGITGGAEIQQTIEQGLRGQGPMGGLVKGAAIAEIGRRTKGKIELTDVEGGGLDEQARKQLENLSKEEEVLDKFARATAQFSDAVANLSAATRGMVPRPPMPPAPGEDA